MKPTTSETLDLYFDLFRRAPDMAPAQPVAAGEAMLAEKPVSDEARRFAHDVASHIDKHFGKDCNDERSIHFEFFAQLAEHYLRAKS